MGDKKAKFDWSHCRISTIDSKVRTIMPVKHNKQYHTVLLNSFHLNGHIAGFQPLTQKLESSCTG